MMSSKTLRFDEKLKKNSFSNLDSEYLIKK